MPKRREKSFYRPCISCPQFCCIKYETVFEQDIHFEIFCVSSRISAYCTGMCKLACENEHMHIFLFMIVFHILFHCKAVVWKPVMTAVKTIHDNLLTGQFHCVKFVINLPPIGENKYFTTFSMGLHQLLRKMQLGLNIY